MNKHDIYNIRRIIFNHYFDVVTSKDRMGYSKDYTTELKGMIRRLSDILIGDEKL